MTDVSPGLDWFSQWMRDNDESTPDLDAMASEADLPSLLKLSDGRMVSDASEWPLRREQLRGLLEKWFWGRIPPEPPPLDDAEVLAEERERGMVRRKVAVRFACEPPVTITLETIAPDDDGPLPVFLTQTTHRIWALAGVSRGYLCCVYPGADEDDQSAKFTEAYPDCDWATIPRRAWLAGRALDYIQTLDTADMTRVAITGHSRNGKQSLIAAAIDPRISAVVSSSAGAAGASPYRFTCERELLESVEVTTRLCPDWFHPRLRFFTGREHKLPTDTHAYMALIAPRPCLISSAYYDGCESVFGVERAVRSAREVYDLLGRADGLGVRLRPGGHETNAHDLQSYFDFFDTVFDRGGNFRFSKPMLHFDWAAWNRSCGRISDPPPVAGAARPESVREAIRWALGDEPPAGVQWGTNYGCEKDHDATMMRRLDPPEGVRRIPVEFGDYVAGDLFVPADADEPLPAVIYQHPYVWPNGYQGAYVKDPENQQQLRPAFELPQRGYACFAFDMLGFGRRLQEGAAFPRRWPGWSKLGRMIRDVRAAVDFLLGGEGRFGFEAGRFVPEEMPEIDAERIFCAGYSLGGMVSLYAAAMEERLAGAASLAGFTPMRTDTDNRHTGGLRRFWEWYAIQPRLGLFAGRESELPYDFDDVLSLIAPRPALIVSPSVDRDATLADVTACVDRARESYARKNAADALTHHAPQDYARFHFRQFGMLAEWLDETCG